MSLRQTFRQQAEDCAAMGSPVMARLMSGLAEDLQPGTPVTDHIFALHGHQTTRTYALPLRLAGGLRGAEPPMGPLRPERWQAQVRPL